MSDPAITAEAAAEGGRVLALRVLEQAIMDATSAPIPRGRARSQCRAVEEERQDAVRFLTEPDGEWAAARTAWCDLAGVTTEWLSRQIANLAMRGSSQQTTIALGHPSVLKATLAAQEQGSA